MSNPKNYRADAIRILSEYTRKNEATVAKANKLTDIGIDARDDVGRLWRCFGDGETEKLRGCNQTQLAP